MPAGNPQIGETWRFIPDGMPANKKYWNQDVTVKDVQPNIRYKWNDHALRDPTKPNGSIKSLQKFLDKFEHVPLSMLSGLSTQTVSSGTPTVSTQVSEVQVLDFLKSPAPAPAPTKPRCAICTDDNAPLTNGKCDGCRVIHSQLRAIGSIGKFNKKDYYGIETFDV